VAAEGLVYGVAAAAKAATVGEVERAKVMATAMVSGRMVWRVDSRGVVSV